MKAKTVNDIEVPEHCWICRFCPERGEQYPNKPCMECCAGELIFEYTDGYREYQSPEGYLRVDDEVERDEGEVIR